MYLLQFTIVTLASVNKPDALDCKRRLRGLELKTISSSDGLGVWGV